MSKTKWLAASCVMMLWGASVCAQSTEHVRIMGIDEMFQLADENSKSIRSFSTGKLAANEAVKDAKAQRLPNIDVSLSGSYIANGYLWDRHFNDGMSVDMPHWGNNFAVQAQQVIYSGGAISSGIEMASLAQKMAELDLQKNRQEIRFMLTGYYLDLYKLYNQQQVLENNLQLTEQVIRNMEARREQGTALKNDITRYELQKENLKLQLNKVKDAAQILNHQLVTTLHLDNQTTICPDSTLLNNEVKALAESNWQSTASQNNIHLQQAEVAVKMNQQKERLERAKRLPQLALVAEEHLDGPILIEVPVINKNFNYWFVGIGAKYNLSSIFKNKSKVKQAQFASQQAEEQRQLAEEQVENAVHASYTNFMTAYTELNTQLKSVELANQNYEVTSNRYKNDLALLTDMLDASNMKLSADMALVNARINVVYNYYKMKYVSHSL